MKRLKGRWRGTRVILIWIIWLPLYATVETLIRVLLIPSPQCSREGCSPPEGWALWMSLVFWFGPPLLFTVMWLRERGRRKATEPAV